MFWSFHSGYGHPIGGSCSHVGELSDVFCSQNGHLKNLKAVWKCRVLVGVIVTAKMVRIPLNTQNGFGLQGHQTRTELSSKVLGNCPAGRVAYSRALEGSRAHTCLFQHMHSWTNSTWLSSLPCVPHLKKKEGGRVLSLMSLRTLRLSEVQELESHLDGKRCRSPAEKEINGNWERKGNTQSPFLDNGDLQAVIEGHISPLSSHSTTNEEVNWFLFKYAFGKEKKLRILMTFTWHPEDPHVPLQKPEDQIISRNDLCTSFSHSLNYWAPSVLCGYPSYLRNEEQDGTVTALREREEEEGGSRNTSS